VSAPAKDIPVVEEELVDEQEVEPIEEMSSDNFQFEPSSTLPTSMSLSSYTSSTGDSANSSPLLSPPINGLSTSGSSSLSHAGNAINKVWHCRYPACGRTFQKRGDLK
jgi:hypothetical protein